MISAPSAGFMHIPEATLTSGQVESKRTAWVYWLPTQEKHHTQEFCESQAISIPRGDVYYS